MIPDDDVTPTARPRVANDANRGIVLALGHHALVLEQTCQRLAEIGARIASSVAPVSGGELVEIGRVFRAEADSAGDLARAAELAANGAK